MTRTLTRHTILCITFCYCAIPTLSGTDARLSVATLSTVLIISMDDSKFPDAMAVLETVKFSVLLKELSKTSSIYLISDIPSLSRS